jgi:hypothetical protein
MPTNGDLRNTTHSVYPSQVNSPLIQFIGLWAAILSVIPVTYGAEFAGGTGTPADPYQIATAEQLLAIRQDWALQDKHFALIADIELDPSQPSHVLSGTLLNLSSGTFDGRGHRIINLRIVPRDMLGPRPGTLGPQAIVRDLQLEGVSTVGDFGRLPFPDYDFGVLARQNEGLIANCSLKGPSCGIGLVASNTGHILGCSVAVDDGGASHLVGVNSGIILFSHVTGGLAVDGGLVRENSGMISGCYSTVAVSGQSTAGGLVGTNSGAISRCYATGAVSVQGSEQPDTCLAGGLVGANSGVVSDCYASGASFASGAKYNHNYAGGLAGNNTGTIFHCYATGASGQGLIADTANVGLPISCYHLHPADGGGNINGLGIPLTDAQMCRRENFIGWDFWGSDFDGVSDIWYMSEGGGYPMLADLQGPPLDGSGTAEDPYLIGSAAQLRTICYDADAHYRLISDIDLRGQTFTGPVIPVFLGHLDGDDHTLFNFTLSGEGDIGFFGTVCTGAEIGRLNLYNVHVMTSQGSGMKLASALAVHNHGMIASCTVSADTSIPLCDVEFIGGLVGVNEGDGQVSQCFVSWSAMGWFEQYRGGYAYWGAVAGGNIGRIAECHASSLVSGSIARCAALVGQNDGTITDCYADGFSKVAGLVHSNNGSIANCYAAVRVPSGWSAGGLVSVNQGGTIASSYSLVLADGGGPDNGLGTFLSDAQMKTQSSFNGWDFDGTWSFREGEGYPYLRWEPDAQRLVIGDAPYFSLDMVARGG